MRCPTTSLSFFAVVLHLFHTPGWAADARLDDQAIADAIKDQYFIDRTVDVSGIDIGVHDGIVELKGQVSSLLAKERASRIAGRVKGVRAVTNRLSVVPAIIRSDADIEREVERALTNDPAIDADDVAVSFNNNVATLTGEVQSWAQRDLALKAVKAVRGVLGVNDEITLKVSECRPDAH